MRRATWLLVALGFACSSGCGGTDRANGPTAGAVSFEIPDLDWVRGQYFLLYDPNVGSVYDIDEPSLQLYLDDNNAGNNVNAHAGRAVIDPDGAMQLPLSSEQDTTPVRGQFDRLTPGPAGDFEILSNVYAFHDTVFKVIRLRRPIPTNSNQTLAVAYTARPIVGPGHGLGAPIAVGGRIISTVGPDSGSILLKLLRIPRNRQATLDGVHYDDSAPLAVVRELEIKSFYNIGRLDIDPRTFTLSVRLGQTDPPVTSSNGVPFIELLGLDTWTEDGSVAHGHDGRVDSTGYNSQTRGWMDFENGVLFLPDARPFAPRLDAAHPFERFLDAQVSRRLRLGESGSPNPGGEDIYELYSPKAFNAQWYLVAQFAAPPVMHAKP